jgi:hypothetical protein
MTITVREFSAAGPCITLGELVRETPKSFFVRDRHGHVARFGKDRSELRHTAPCCSCRDHATTQYPNGYED